MKMANSPLIKLGIVAVSRDCFPVELSRKRLNVLVKTAKLAGIEMVPSSTIIENENDVSKALGELRKNNVNALVVYLGNFGPEGPTARLIKEFGGPCMACAAAEETGKDMINGRGDAFCGLMNLSYNLNLNNLNSYIPENPVGLAEELTGEIRHFEKIARIHIAVRNLKIITFGPRPQDFLACNAPIKPLFDMGVNVMENSELDLYNVFSCSKESKETDAIARDMARELGKGNTYPDMLKQLARLESSLLKFAEDNKGMSEYVIFANKCWPAFQRYFGCVPCYVNSRLAGKGMPVACEVDIYGALSQYICQLATDAPATLLDINNTVPSDMITEKKLKGYAKSDLFMGFHCGNTNSACLEKGCSIKYQLIMNRLMEKGEKPVITRGTLEGRLKSGTATVFRLQSSASGKLNSYLAEGHILDIDPKSFGGIGVIAIPEMARFYRHVLLEYNFPHHAALAFNHAGKVIFDAVKLLSGIVPMTPLPKSVLYSRENPFNQ